MKIKITNLKTIPLVIKLENPIELSTRFVDKREFTIVQIFTDIGLIGESCVPIGDPISVASIIERKHKDLVICQDPLDYEKIHRFVLSLLSPPARYWSERGGPNGL